jgi:hypothetical protein
MFKYRRYLREGMTGEGTRRLIEASSPDLSDSQIRLIYASSEDPEAELRDFEERGFNTGRSDFVDNYLSAQRRKAQKTR